MSEDATCSECRYFNTVDMPAGDEQPFPDDWGICKRLPPCAVGHQIKEGAVYYLGKWPVVKADCIQCGEALPIV